MEKTVRCTVCTWRGPWVVAEGAPRAQRSEIPPAMEEVQEAIEETHRTSGFYGMETPPPCPMCGHHTRSVKLHGYRAAI